MSDPEEEIYSTMFSSLKHPARRKILRMLADKPITFSQMVDELGISSSHLTYHLESLGALVSKTEDGKYKLSRFGETCVSTMRGVEEVPTTQPQRFLSLAFKWKAILAAAVIAIVLLASLAYIQTSSISQLAQEQENLRAELAEATAKYQQLLSWSNSTDKALSFLQNVAQIDIAKYQVTLMSDTVEYRSDIGGVLEEIVKYALTSNESKVDAVLRFRNKNLSRYQLYLLEGSPLYAQPQPVDILDVSRGFLERYGKYAGAAYVEEMKTVAAQINETRNTELTKGNIKLNISIAGDKTEILWLHTENGVDFSPKSLSLVFEGNMLKEVTDGWFLFKIGSTQINISAQEAVGIARNAAKDFTWRANGVEVTDFTVLEEPVTVLFHPSLREDLSLIPYWHVTLYLDKVYAGGVNRITVGIWADNGKIAQIKAATG
ncbi:MAG: winged helix-turn-helix domain-containing protein [Candidatus Bathyarchaeota archaeon]|nr:winged helix-turn-helix domain-containing protein [Candidatus Bathyarchaeota archaeon]